ncbi:CRISPR-associated helicase Cas3' [Solibacillus sp. FSL K6-1523]|uniref:CRISPR-associated helicase Cas3' n=1 Tax=Solibacillus sp. FSL K6-1523 TaxID=2921471 RepID=UPI0030F9D9F2
MFIAHIRKEDEIEQPLKVHLLEVQAICEKIGKKFNMPSVFGLAGLLHDLGKYSDDFQIYLREAVANPDKPPKRGSVNHSTAGGRLLMERFHGKQDFQSIMVEMISNAIYSHHGQLMDFINPDGKSPFLERENNDNIPMEIIKKRFFEEVMSEEAFDAYVTQAVIEFFNFSKSFKPSKEDIRFKIAPHLTNCIFSSLIDADRTNSRDFDENNPQQEALNIEQTFTTYLNTLEQKLHEMQQEAIPNNITKLRQQMSDNCYDKAMLPTGIYSLSIPTGGGKTLASLRFGLKHAIEHGKDRIIYVVPFTTIIEQNAQTVRKLLDTKELLEHHSNVTVEEREATTYDELTLQRQLNNAKDNWDIPIVFTTMVQYLNSFYSGKGRNLRRLHNLSNAVIIFDEVQSVPPKCVSLFNESIIFLSKYAKSTIVLCTATQPALQHVKRNIQTDGELVENLTEIEQAFKRTAIVPMDEHDEWTTDQLSEFIEDKLDSVRSILIISNNKRTTKDLYTKFANRKHVYHLSTGMCPAHRQEKLEQMRIALKNKEQVLCMSTQLIEAGVDVSFECVMRSLAGVDSIAQAAGRCNRNGEVDVREVYVFRHAEENLGKLETIEKGQRCASYLMRDMAEHGIFGGELLSSAAIEFYFKQYYEELALELDFPVKDLDESLHHMLFSDNRQYVQQESDLLMRASFQTAADRFQVIDANTEAILVPHGEGKNLIVDLTSGDPVDYKQFLKKVQHYSVNVFPHEMRALQQEKLVVAVDFGVFKIWMAKDGTYDENYGLSVTGEARQEDLIW